MEEQSPTYQVVSDGDVRDVATDAAETALSRQSVVTDEDLRSVADAAASSAVDELANQVDESVAEVAGKAAEGAVSGVQETLDAQLREIESRSESLEGVSVQLDSDQYAFIQDSLRIQSTCSLFTLLIACAILGAVVTNFFVMGWRR